MWCTFTNDDTSPDPHEAQPGPNIKVYFVHVQNVSAAEAEF